MGGAEQQKNRRALSEAQLLCLWGKTADDDSGGFHPVLFHLIDVGSVALLLWDYRLSPRQRHCIAAALGLSETDARVVVALLAAVHDIGKAYPSFQAKDGELAMRVASVAGLPVFDCGKNSPPHSFVSAKILPDLWSASGGGWAVSGSLALDLASITGAHHGTFPTSYDLEGTGYSPAALGSSAWDGARWDLLVLTCRLLFPDVAVPPMAPAVALEDPGVVPILAGLISVADWIGSSQDFFPPAARPGAVTPDGRTYAPLAMQRASEALQAFGWLPGPRWATPADFRAVFPKLPGPNSLQEVVIDLVSKQVSSYVLIIEEAMGGGKTEAALFCADLAITRGLAFGLYVAMPTQATGNAMFDRVLRDYLRAADADKGDFRCLRGHDGPNVMLLHGNALLSERFECLRWATTRNGRKRAAFPKASGSEDQEEGEARISAESWFAGRKRSLLAPMGVGTVDQGLLGVLQTRHWFVRLFGLAGKVVVFDEVHAYDVYMNRLFSRLLTWLAALDCPVILLSATLTRNQRRELLAAYAGEDAAAHAFANDESYPRITAAFLDNPGTAIVRRVPPAKGKKPPIACEWSSTGLNALAGLITENTPDDSCGIIVCNTVARAQAAYDALQVVAGRSVQLLHARMPFCWREQREAWALTTFGKDSTPEERRGKILVATAIVEASLDLDSDWMVTDLAPVDLILQRVGRLHRHPGRLRPEGAKSPRVWILCDDVTTYDVLPGLPPGSDAVYAPYVLLRTVLALRSRKTLAFPDSIADLVRDVYDDPEPADLPKPWTIALAEAFGNLDRKRRAAEQEAERRLIKPPVPGEDGVADILENRPGALFDDDDPRTHEDVRATTRLGRPSITIVCTGTAVPVLESGTVNLASLPETEGHEPDLRQVRELLRWSVPISHVGVFQALKYASAPPGWNESSLLRYCRALRFDTGVCDEVPGYRLMIDRDHGVRIEKLKECSQCAAGPEEDID